MDAEPPKKKRPCRPSGTSSVRLDGDLLLSIHEMSENRMILTPTTTVDDYAQADEHMVAHNSNMIDARDKSLGSDQWDDGCGVWRLKLDCDPQLAINTYMEFRSLFQDGVLTLKAPQEQNPDIILGGWLKPYQNTISRDQADQQKSVLAIPAKSFPKVKKAMPFLNELVVHIKKALLKEFRTDERTNLKAVEYTFFCGTYQASCTKWHQDTAEHPEDQLVFTTLTLLTLGNTSMCIAGKQETWLRTQADTVCFEPDLFHRSGETHRHVVKLSIHWRDVTKSPAPAEQGAEQGASSSCEVKQEQE